MEKYYQILNLKPTASLQEIKQAYRQLARKWHPDRFINEPKKLQEAQEKFKKINQAYEILKAYITEQKQENKKITPEIIIKKGTAEYFFQLGIEIVKKGNLEQSLDYFARAIQLKPDYLEALIYRKQILEKLGFKYRAKADARKILEIELKERKKSNQKVKSQNKSTKKKNKRNQRKYQFLKCSWRSKIRFILIFIISFLILFLIIMINF